MRKHQYRDIICDTCECRHLSVEDIFEAVKKREPKIGRATVYRNIESLANEGVIRKLPGINGKSYYVCNSGTKAHLVDEKTGILCDFPLEQVNIDGIPEGYEISEIRIQIKKHINHEN